MTSEQFTPTGGQTIFPRINFLKTFSSRFDQRSTNGRIFLSGGGLFADATLDLNLAASLSLTDRVSGNNLITFSRASIGTYVDSDGLIKTSPVNLLTYSEQFDQWTVASSSVITPNAVAAPDGTFTADRVYFSRTGATNISQDVTLTQGQTYTFSVYAKAVTPGSNNEFQPYINSPSPKYPINSFEATSEWVRFSYTFTHDDSTAATPIFILNSGDLYVTNVYFWGAQLEESSTATIYIPTTSTISGAPRFDHDPVTGESLGLLIEENRTNQLLHNAAFSNTLWIGTNTSVLDDQIVAPNGATEADKLTAANTANEVRHIRQDSTIIEGKTYTQSIFAKAGEVTILQIVPSTKFENDFQNFDLSTGQLGSGGSGAATIEAYPNGWYRCSLTRDSIGATNQGRMLFALVESTTSTRVESFQADAGDGLYLWGAQLEEDSTFPSSYISTASSAVTRSPDTASIEGTDFSSWYNQSEGTIFSDMSPLDADSGRAYLFNSGNANQRLGQNTGDDTTFALFMSKGGATSLATAVSGMPKPIKACLAYKPGSSRGIIDGQLQTLSTASNVPDAINQVGLGSQNFAPVGGFLNGHITRLAYFPTRLTDEELVTLTS